MTLQNRQICNQCILPESFPGIKFNQEGICNYCYDYKNFEFGDEELFVQTLEKLKRRKKGPYDALVPLSGGKDSTYTLYLAINKYNLNVMTYTFDNGFLSESALKNIRTITDKTGVDYLFVKPGLNTLKRFFRAALLQAGELCSPCGLGIQSSCNKISRDMGIPMLLLGTSTLEKKCPPPEKMYDLQRFSAILFDAQIEDSNYWYDNPGLKIFTPLNYSRLKEDEIKALLEKEMGWQDWGKHSDCIAEPFSNYLREHRYGFSRRACFYSEMIRRGEMKRDEALEKLADENPAEEPKNLDEVLSRLGLTRDELKTIIKIPPFKYAKYCYQPPKWKKLTPRRILRYAKRKIVGSG